jgi:prepilin-type N-terminal cleavage/methylation domain-containing protein
MKKHFKLANAFTLLELLVVVAVIAILAALLFPVFKSAKDRARRTACLNNLKQINLGVHMYCDDSGDMTPSSETAAVATNPATLYSAYKAFMKSYVGLQGASSSRDKLFACPADTFYPGFVSASAPPAQWWQCMRQSLHDQPILDFSSYAFNGGDNITRMAGTIAWQRPGLTGVKLGSVKHPARTVLVAEASALVPWSWHEPSSLLVFNDAKNMVSFVDGHVLYIKIYWDSTPLPHNGVSFALAYDPPSGYHYQWSGN